MTSEEQQMEVEEEEIGRRYQIAMCEMAKDKNCIICLPTGSGKTYIALQLMKYYLPDTVLNSKKIVFLANTVPLVHQQANYIRKQLFLQYDSNGGVKKSHVTEITGDMNVDIWGSDKWVQVIENTKIFVMTSQILLDALSHAYLTFKQINLLILDECHHADKDHPMARIMEKYDKIKDSSYELPRILGLTATIIKGSLKKGVDSEVSSIESRLCCKAVTYHDYEEVLRHSTKADVQIKMYSTCPEEIKNVANKISQLIDNNLAILRSHGSLLLKENRPVNIEEPPHATLKKVNQIFRKKKSSLDDQLKILTDVGKLLGDESLGIYGTRLAAILKRSYLESYQENDRRAVMLQKGTDAILARIIGECDLAMRDYDPYFKISSFVSGKVNLLFKILLDWWKEKGDQETLCGIVFCNERLTAQILTWIFLDAVQYCGDVFKFIKPAFVIGSSRFNNDIEEQRITTKKQEETIQRFHDKKINLIFATNVLEEGLNVPDCNVVIRFDPMQKYPSFVQSMGRARKRGALFCVLTSENNFPQNKKLVDKYTKFSQELATHLSTHASHVDEDDVDHEKPSMDTDLSLAIDPSDPDSPTITMTDAVSLVYRYCQLLASDRFVKLEPLSWWVDVEEPGTKLMFKAFVQLPTNAAFRDVVEGKERSTKNDAKRAAFLEVCKKLYECGALDSRLMPRRFVLPKKVVNCLVEMEREEEVSGFKKDDKNLKWYPKMIPACLDKASILPCVELSVFKINIKLIQATADSVEHGLLYNFERKIHTLAILSVTDLTDIPPGYLYGRHGTLEYSFERIILKSGSSLTSDEISKIKNFQTFVFSDILRVQSHLFVEKNTDHFLVPALIQDENRDWDIDWKLFEKLDKIDELISLKAVSESARSQMSWSSEDYEDSVVIPWYKSYDIRRADYYCVSSLRRDLTPDSPVDETDVDAKSFSQYYSNKYGLKIMNTDRPFLAAVPLGKRLNYLTKKRDLTKMKREDVKEQRYVSSIEILVPEFVVIHPMPASIFAQIKFLPSIIHRTYRLLLARQIQVSLGQKFNWRSAIDCKDGVGQGAIHLTKYGDDNYQKNSIQNKNTPITDETVTLASQVNNVHLSEAYLQLGRDPVRAPCNRASKEKNKDGANHLDYVHPDKISCKDIKMYKTWKTSKSNLNDPENSENISTPTNIAYILPDKSECNFESMDAATDFSLIGGPTADAVMEAITLANAHDAGSLERLEVIGDSFLKYCISTHIFCEFSEDSEGVMTSIRTKFVSNKHLFVIGLKNKLGDYLSGGVFVPDSSWLPLGVTIPAIVSQAAITVDRNFDIFDGTEISDIQKMSAEELVQTAKLSENYNLIRSPTHTTYTHTRMAKKRIADCVESLIGVYYIHSGIDGALRCMDWLGLHGPNQLGELVKYKRCSPTGQLLKIPRNGLITKPEQLLPMLDELETVLKYRFKNKWLVVEAFTHPGYPKNRVTHCYQRLEFLGDAVLDFLVTNHIYKNELAITPGGLTDLRSALVNNVTFGSLTVRYGFQKFLLSISKQLQDGIDKFVAYQAENFHAVTGHFKLLNDLEAPVAEEIEVPKVLGDLFESLAGAVFVDSEMSLDATWEIFYRLMKNEIDLFGKVTPKSPIRELSEIFPGISFKSHNDTDRSNETNYALISVRVNNATYFGRGTNKKQAKQAAAKYALRCIRKNSR